MVRIFEHPRGWTISKLVLIAASLMLFELSCDRNHESFHTSYSEALATAMADPRAMEFTIAFPMHRGFIRGLERTNKAPALILEGILHGRYLITMVAPLEVDGKYFRVKRVNTPSFIAQEIRSFEPGEGQRYAIEMQPESERRFGLTEWRVLISNGMDLKLLHISPVTNNPISDIDRYLKRRTQ